MRREQILHAFTETSWRTKCGGVVSGFASACSTWREIADLLSRRPYDRVPVDEIYAAAAWTIAEPTHAKTRLGQYLINWCNGWLRRNPQATQDPSRRYL